MGWDAGSSLYFDSDLHGLKKESVTFNFAKVFKRVLLPFFLVEVLTFIIAAVVGAKERNELIMSGLIGGGTGLVLIIHGYIYKLLCSFRCLIGC